MLLLYKHDKYAYHSDHRTSKQVDKRSELMGVVYKAAVCGPTNTIPAPSHDKSGNHVKHDISESLGAVSRCNYHWSIGSPQIIQEQSICVHCQASYRVQIRENCQIGDLSDLLASKLTAAYSISCHP